MGKVLMSGIVPKLREPSVLPPVGTALNDLTWEQIRAISDAGLAGSYFSAGDTKSIIINGKVGATTFSNLAIDVFIIGIDHNSSIEGTNKIHFQIGKISGKDVCLCDANYDSQQAVSGKFVMNTSYSNSGGWASSHMRKTILGSNSTPANPTANTLLAALPSDLRAVMKSVSKYSDNTGGNSDTASSVTANTDYLWLLSEFEVLGTKKYANSAEQNYQKQYDYYKAGNSKVKYKHNATGTAATWWVRSPCRGTTYNFCIIYSGGIVGGSGAYYCVGVTPSFAV